MELRDVSDLSAVKTQYGVPTELQSCHTAIVDGFVIEGRVPAANIERLLAERPDIARLSVPGMPVGSLGMEVEDVSNQPFDVLAFDADGNVVGVFASYK